MNMEFPEILPPHDANAEEAVLGSLLIDGSIIDQLNLEPSDFYNERNQDYYHAMLSLRKEGVSINQITLCHVLTETSKEDLSKACVRMANLIAACPTSLDCLYYAAIVKKLSVFRRLITLGSKISGLGYGATGSEIQAIAEADRLILDLKRNHGQDELITPKMFYDKLFDRYNSLYSTESEVSLPTGFYDLDHALGGGLFDGELVILAADSGVGKSTLAMNFASHQCQYGNILFCSCEMRHGGLGDREVSSILGTDIRTIRAGHYDVELFDRIIQEALPAITERPIYLFEKMPLSVTMIKQAAYSMKARYGLRGIVVDYLQKLDIIKSRENRYVQIGQAVGELKDLAMELGVPLLLVAQLGSDMNKRTNKRPTIGDIYESKMVEQHADIVLLIYRISKYFSKAEWDDIYNDVRNRQLYGFSNYRSSSYPANMTEVLIAKQRQGGGQHQGIYIIWDSQRHSFTNAEKVE